MSVMSLISRVSLSFTSATVAEEVPIPAGTNTISIRKISDDASLTIEINEQTETPETDAELYQVTTDETTKINLPFYAGMETLFITSPVGSSCQVEFRQRGRL